MTPNYWDMSDEELAAAYAALTAPFVADLGGINAEALAFIEAAIMQRIGAPSDADPSVSEEWQAALEGFVRAQQHSPECEVTKQRANLLAALAQDPDNAYLVGALPEYEQSGDQEVELCNCGFEKASA